MTSRPLTLLIADDHPLFRKGLRQVLEAEKQIGLLEEAGDGESALRIIETSQPSIAILDIDMPGKSGFDVARGIRAKHLNTSIIFLTMYKEEDMFDEAMDLGAKGYVLKENAVADIVASVRSVALGEYYISPQLSSLLMTRRGERQTIKKNSPGIDELTASERRILRLISEGKTTKEIAEELFISPKTVDNHRTNISTKLDLHGSHSLLKFALEHKSRL